jgi:hypothetical protein
MVSWHGHRPFCILHHWCDLCMSEIVGFVLLLT